MTLSIKNSNFVQNFGIKIESNQDCVILGNGPSLKDTLNSGDLDFIKQKKKFCVNEAVHSEYFQLLKPDYLVFMDSFYWTKDVAEPHRSSYLKINEFLSTIDWEMKIFMPKHAQNWNFFKDVPEKNKNVEIIYIETNTSSIQNENVKFLEYKQNLAMPRVQNVLVACLYLAINIGFKNVYVFGADHSWHETIYINYENMLCLKDKHFYDEKQIEEHKPAYKNPEGTELWTMAEFFEAFSYKYKSYEELEKYSQSMGTKIYNSSKISYIDAFERLAL